MSLRTCGTCCRQLRPEQPAYCSRACSNVRGRRSAAVTVRGEFAYVALPDGQEAVIDAGDAALAQGQPWRVNSEGYVGYTRYTPRDHGLRKSSWVFLHRLIAGTPPRMTTDHVDGDTLNNRRRNLRIVRDSQNAKNKRTRTRAKTSAYKGVHRYKDGRWAAKICADYRGHHLGYFDSEVDAARAYDAAAVRLHGEFAALNFSE